jgi:hypothetical protein
MIGSMPGPSSLALLILTGEHPNFAGEHLDPYTAPRFLHFLAEASSLPASMRKVLQALDREHCLADDASGSGTDRITSESTDYTLVYA